MSRRRPSLRRATLVVAAAAVALVAIPSAARADPGPSVNDIRASQAHAQSLATRVGAIRSQILSAQGRLDRLMVTAGKAVEAYNGARYQLGQAQQAASAAGARADRAARGYATAQARLGTFAAQAYMTGGPTGSMLLLLDAGGPADLLSRAATLSVVASHHDAVVNEATASRVVADVLRQQADQAVAEARAAAVRVDRARKAAEAAVAAQQGLVTQLAAQRRHAATELGLARAHTLELTVARQRAVAQAAREKAARAKAARERAARERAAGGQGSGGSSGGSPGGSSGGGTPAPPGGSTGSLTGAAAAVAFARAQLGEPYVFGAAGPDAWDCSGLTMAAWAAGGVSMPHWAPAQYAQGEKVTEAQARPGDLVFYATDPTNWQTIYHVGLYIGGGQMIEAPHTGDVVKIIDIHWPTLFGFSRP